MKLYDATATFEVEINLLDQKDLEYVKDRIERLQLKIAKMIDSDMEAEIRNTKIEFFNLEEM